MGDWITTPMDQSISPYIRKSMSFSKAITKARLYMTGLSLYWLEVNGQKIEIKHPAKTHEEAVDFTLKQLIHPDYKVIDSLDEISAIGHRLLNGGEKIQLTTSTTVTSNKNQNQTK